jgi:hypothetical protein
MSHPDTVETWMQIEGNWYICCGYTAPISFGDVDYAFKVLDTVAVDSAC